MILSDPPWDYQQYRTKGAHGAAESHYPVMSIDRIMDIPVRQWASPDGCVLALWCTLPHLPEGLRVMEGAGFTYRTAIPWVKTVPSVGSIQRGIGIWFMQSAELCLFGQMGKVGGFKERRGVQGFLVGDDRVLYAPGRKHSEKPHDLYEYLEMFSGPRLELFAREKREGWTSWGLELGQELGPWGVRPAQR